MERPIHEMLQGASKRLSLHMPAAQGRPPFDRLDAYRIDTTELPITDDLYRPTGAIGRAQALAAQSAGAAHTLLLPGGSTAGIQAMLLYAARRGETVILPRNAHLSALNACAIAGLDVVFAKPSYTALGRAFTEVAAYEAAMAEHPAAKAVLAVRPDYYGLSPNLSPIAEAAHRRGMLLLCDEAHGATFNWRSDAQNAGACGADLFVQSAHKTLPALTAGAWLHASAGMDAQRLRERLRMVQTSSPSFVTMRSLDDARAWMDAYGEKACTELAKAMKTFYRKAATLGYQSGQDDAPQGFAHDPLRLVLRAPEGGYALEAALRERDIDVEMADAECIVCILSLIDGRKRLKRLYKALTHIRQSSAEGEGGGGVGQGATALPPMGLPERALPLGEAAFAPSEAVPLPLAVGRVSAAHIGLYPPGVALCVAGERFSRDMVDFLLQTDAKRLFGLPCAEHALCVTMENETQPRGKGDNACEPFPL